MHIRATKERAPIDAVSKQAPTNIPIHYGLLTDILYKTAIAENIIKGIKVFCFFVQITLVFSARPAAPPMKTKNKFPVKNPQT